MLGGTFNPPHAGHLAMARHAHDDLGLDRVLLVPVHTPPHKTAEDDPGPQHRLAMVRLMAEEAPWLEACEAELQRGGASYTADTLRELHEREPESELTLIVGADMARTLPAWRDPQAILSLARVAIAEREGSVREQIVRTLEPLAGDRLVNAASVREGRTGAPRIVFLDMPEVSVSSTMVRDTVAAGGPLQGLVTEKVGNYIAAHGLYGAQPREEEQR